MAHDRRIIINADPDERSTTRNRVESRRTLWKSSANSAPRHGPSLWCGAKFERWNLTRREGFARRVNTEDEIAAWFIIFSTWYIYIYLWFLRDYRDDEVARIFWSNILNIQQEYNYSNFISNSSYWKQFFFILINNLTTYIYT